MGDERCVFPGDGPGTPDRWLDPETAERLLRGEAPDNGVDPTARDQAERLARTLDSLAALAQPGVRENQAELPGEAAALAAFRAARVNRAADGRAESSGEAAALAADRAAEVTVAAASARAHASDAGLFRIGGGRLADVRRPRWGRPVRFGLAAALVAGMVGGVAVAAGTGVLPGPFDGSGPEPAASVSAPVTPVPESTPSRVPSPEAGASTPDGVTGGGAEDGTAEDSASGDPEPDGNGADDRGGVPKDITTACGDLREGRTLDLERRRTLERTAGGSARVPAYCAHVLDGDGDGKGDGGEQDSRTGGTGRIGGTGHSGGTGGTRGTGGTGGTAGAGGQDGHGDQAAAGAQSGGRGGSHGEGGKPGRTGH